WYCYKLRIFRRPAVDSLRFVSSGPTFAATELSEHPKTQRATHSPFVRYRSALCVRKFYAVYGENQSINSPFVGHPDRRIVRLHIHGCPRGAGSSDCDSRVTMTIEH